MINIPQFFNSMKKYVGKNPATIEDFIQNIRGYVDIKGYRGDKMVYHDAGDNIVCDWMRHAILVLMTGASFSRNGNSSIANGNETSAHASYTVTKQVTKPDGSMHGDNDGTWILNYHCKSGNTDEQTAHNYDGYIRNGDQYFWQEDKPGDTGYKYSRASVELSNSNFYCWYPSKVLFGTGKEYGSWQTLKAENESENAAWYNMMLNRYSQNTNNEQNAQQAFNAGITNIGCNIYSGSVANTIYNGASPLMPTRTVNDPNPSAILSSTSTQSKDWGVVGAIKTPYFDSKESETYLETGISADGKMLLPQYQGVGRPCFIYFKYPRGVDGSSSVTNEQWDNPSNTTDVTLSKDLSRNYLHRITFSINLAEQAGSSNSTGAYYPYNGYTLKQLGLFCDSLLTEGVTATSSMMSYPYLNMPCGAMLAKKNITPFLKTADLRMFITWSLSI